MKKGTMDLSDNNLLILEASIEFGADNNFEIKNGSLGMTMYIETPTKLEATAIRAAVPLRWKGLYTIVMYSEKDKTGKNQ